MTNTSPIVLATDIDRFFQPFHRLDPRRVLHTNGHVLGLSIVRAIATAHGATITAQPLPEGGLPQPSSTRSMKLALMLNP